MYQKCIGKNTNLLYKQLINMQVGLSILSSKRTFVGIEIRKGMEPIGVDNRLHFQQTVIVSIGFVFFYLDFIFNSGKPITMKEAMPDFEEISGFEIEEPIDDK